MRKLFLPTSAMHTAFFIVDLIFFIPVAALYGVGVKDGWYPELKELLLGKHIF